MARVSIYVPDEMKVRMDEAGELNWSAAAQRAFEIEINSQRWKMETDVIEKAAARLRASRGEYDNDQKSDGKEVGRRWALEDADYRELKAVVHHNFSELPEEAYASTLCALILDDDRPSNSEVRDLWENLVEDGFRGDDPPAIWVEGFVEGASEAWEEVADKV